MSTLQISGDEFFADVAQDILLYVSRDLSDQVSCSLSWPKGSCLPCPGMCLGAAFLSLPPFPAVLGLGHCCVSLWAASPAVMKTWL